MIPALSIGIVVFLTFIFISWIIKRTVTTRIKPKTKNPLLAVFIGKIIALTITITGLVFFLNIIGLSSIAKHIMAGAGITTFIIGFAFKDIGENFLSGILMAFKSPFKIGDLIEIGGITGYVNELNMRDSVIKTLDGKDVFIPNSQILKAPLFNYTIDGYLRYEFTVGVDYTTNLTMAINIINTTLSNFSEVLQGDKKPVVVVNELAASTVNINILYWIDTFEAKSKAFHLVIKSKIMISLIEALGKNNIYLPANIVEVKNYSNEHINITAGN